VIAVMISGASAMIVALFGTRFLITFFRERGKGQPILGKEDHGPDHHMAKQGTPTMGGLAIIAAAFVGWSVAHLRRDLVFSRQSMIMWCGIIVMSFMGCSTTTSRSPRRTTAASSGSARAGSPSGSRS
jgi:phospho-N-acetylmuramoyl-pentapeptide-transferase